MKKILVAVAFAAYASSAFAAISGGRHDLTTRPGGTALNACQYCHAPHLWNLPTDTTMIGVAPLWNRNASTFTFQGYTSATVNDTTVTLGPSSKTCLACHDGLTNMGVVLNGASVVGIGSMGAGSLFDVGTDLRDDHPVGVNYSVSQTAFPAEYRATPQAPVSLRAGQVECSSCHDPHTLSDGVRGGAAFLVDPQATICGRCHTK